MRVTIQPCKCVPGCRCFTLVVATPELEQTTLHDTILDAMFHAVGILYQSASNGFAQSAPTYKVMEQSGLRPEQENSSKSTVPSMRPLKSGVYR